MGKIGLCIKASLKNVDKFYPKDPKTFSWALKVKCTSCFEVDPNWHLISEDEVVELTMAKAHFSYRCKCCQRENHLIIIPFNQLNLNKNKDKFGAVYESEDEDKFKTMISFDCKGLELVEFEPRDGWAAVSGQKTFEDVDLSDKEWFDYNDFENKPVEIINFEYKFVNIK